jgi:serine/threonine protein kinase
MVDLSHYVIASSHVLPSRGVLAGQWSIFESLFFCRFIGVKFQRPSPGEYFGPYRIVRKIGQGGMGEVYEAWEDDLHRRIALKILSLSVLDKPEVTERFTIEGRALARLKHPNVVGLYALTKQDDQVMMVMEYIDGWPVNRFIEMYPCGIAGILKLFRQILEGVGAAHAASIIHRDIKPQNIMVERNLNVKLLDFGICKLQEFNPELTATGILIGTPNYMAPEILEGNSASVQSDIYSLGLVFYNMLTGITPFSGRNSAEVMTKILRTSLSFPSGTVLPQEIRKLILRMTGRSLKLRFRTVQEVLHALDKIHLERLLPSDLRTARVPKMKIANIEELRAECAQQGFDSIDSGFILNLAALMHEKQHGLSDWEDSAEITEEVFSNVLGRFRKIKSARMRPLHRLRPLLRWRYAPPIAISIAALAVAVWTALPGHRTEPPPAPPHVASHDAPVLPKTASPSPPVDAALPMAPPAIKPVSITLPQASLPVAPAVAKQKPAGVPKHSKLILSAPALLTPDDQAVFGSGESPVLTWQGVKAPVSKFYYEITVKSVGDKNFRKSDIAVEPSYQLQPLPPGYYIWSVRAIGADGTDGPVSEARTLQIRAPEIKRAAAPAKLRFLPAEVIPRQPASK